MQNIKIIYYITIFTFFILFKPMNGQVKIGIYTGYGLSSFEQQDESTDMLPVGLQVYYSLESVEFVSFNFGVDFNYSVIPFAFSVNSTTGETLVTREQNQLHIGALVKIKFVKEFVLNPYVRLGTGLYSGGHNLKFSNSVIQAAQQQQIPLADEMDISNAFGFNFGGGLDIKFTQSGNLGMFLEFVYHLNSREIDETPLNVFQGANFQKSDLGFNNYAILMGFQVGF